MLSRYASMMDPPSVANSPLKEESSPTRWWKNAPLRPMNHEKVSRGNQVSVETGENHEKKHD